MEKVITVDISKSKFLRANPQWQYNHGQKLQFVGVELPPYYEVHFSNSINGEAKKQLGDSSGVLIPFEYFQPGKSIYAWIYITDSDSGITQRQVEIPIHKKAICTDEEPTPEQSDIIEEAIGALNSALDEVDDRIEAALDSAKQSGEFDGKDGEDGSGIWYTKARISGDDNPFVRRRDLIGREGATVQVHDLLFAPDVRDEGEPTTLYEITSVGIACALKRLCKIKGTNGTDGASAYELAVEHGYEGTEAEWLESLQGKGGTSPGVTITEITGGHRITITDEAHPDGQSFDVMDGQDGTRIWWTNSRVISAAVYESDGGVATIRLHSVDGATPAVGDYVYAPEVGQSGAPTALYVITRTSPVLTVFDRICSIKGDHGEDGTSPSVIITEITGGHRITITDEAHPDGQSFDVMDGTGGGVTVDDALSGSSTNPVQNKVVKAALDGKGTYSKPASGIPKTDMAEDVQTSLAKANTALQNHQSLAAYRTSADQDAIDLQQNAAIEAKYTKPPDGIPKTDLAAAVQTSLDKADTALQSFTETDPTVPSWAKASNKPNYTASEVGAIPVPDNIFDGAIPIYDANSSIWDRDDITGLLRGSNAELIFIRDGNYTGEDVLAIEENPAVVLSHFTSNRKTIFVYVQLDGSYIFLTPFYGDETTGEVRFNQVEGYIVREWIFRPEMVNGYLYLICHHNNGGYHRYDIPSTASDVGAVASNQGVANANKVLTVNSSGVVVPEDDRFVVTLTPTAQDYSGVMDKTVAEINAAYEAGKKIVFKVLGGANEVTYADCSMQYTNGSYTYPSFNGFIISDAATPNLLIFAFTSVTNDGTKATYAAHVYPLATGQWTGGSY